MKIRPALALLVLSVVGCGGGGGEGGVGGGGGGGGGGSNELALRTLPASYNAGVVYDPARNALWVNSPGTSPTGHVYRVDLATETVGTSFAVGRQPSALALSDDGSTIYEAEFDGSLRRLDLTTGTVGAPFFVPMPQGAAYVNRLAFQPGSTRTVAASFASADGRSFFGASILDDSTPRSSAIADDLGGDLAWTSPDRLLGLTSQLPERSIEDVAVSAAGATVSRSVTDVVNAFARGFSLNGGRIYANDGTVLDATSLAVLGAFTPSPIADGTNETYGPAVSNGYAYFVRIGTDGSFLRVYRTSDFSLVTALPLTAGDGGRVFGRVLCPSAESGSCSSVRPGSTYWTGFQGLERRLNLSPPPGSCPPRCPARGGTGSRLRKGLIGLAS